MMTKASFMMNEQLRRKVPLVQLVHPSLLFSRARIPFPQGQSLIAEIFKGKAPAEMYAHHYFIEKQSDPMQPSPQYHITEEYQGMLKVMKGLRYMSDATSKLDTTMVAVLDDGTREVFLYNPSELDEASLSQMMSELAKWGIAEAVVESQARTEAQKHAPNVPGPGPQKVQNEGNTMFRTSEAAQRHDGANIPSAYTRHKDAQASHVKASDKPSKSARVSAIVLPTRQALWEPVRYWMKLFPDAYILSSLTVLPSDEQLTTARFSPEEVAHLQKRFRPIEPSIAVSEATVNNNCVALSPEVDLLRVLGDPSTDEFVLHHKGSGTLSCTDVFHGGYSDFDPMNTWMCRVFFKFMKQGNYKRVDIPPQYKMDSIVKRGDLELFRSSVSQLCNSDRQWNTLIFAHGTPPLIEDPRDALQLQWGLRQQTPEEVRAFEVESRQGGEELYGDVPDQRPEEDFLLRRRRF